MPQPGAKRRLTGFLVPEIKYFPRIKRQIFVSGFPGVNIMALISKNQRTGFRFPL